MPESLILVFLLLNPKRLTGVIKTKIYSPFNPDLFTGQHQSQVDWFNTVAHLYGSADHRTVWNVGHSGGDKPDPGYYLWIAIVHGHDPVLF